MSEAHSSRLVTLVRAGPFRLALPAEAVRSLSPGVGDAPSLLEALGEPDSGLGAWTVALHGEADRRYRLDGIEGVRPRGDSPSLNLPAGLGVDAPELFRGAFHIDGALAIELRPEALGSLDPRPSRQPLPLPGSGEPVGQALVFISAGRSMAFPLTQVLSVVAKPSVCPVPRAGKGLRGVVEHAQMLYPVVDLGARYFDRPSDCEFGILVDQEGRGFMVLADSVVGVRNGFRPLEGDEPGWLQGERGERALFVQLEG